MSDGDTESIGAAIRRTANRVEAPAGLHAHVVPGRLREEPPRRGRFNVALGGAAVALVAAFAVMGALLLSDETTEPTVTDAAPLALRPATAAPPARDPADGHFIQAEVGGVRFPNYAYDTPWKTLGARTDKLSGRDTMTVLYSTRGGHVGYTIVGGEALDVPDGARTVSTGGRSFKVLRRAGALVVTWRQAGRTCIVSGRGATLPQLLRFATWR
jgi:hypothetical protein